MDLDALRATLAADEPPAGLSLAGQTLWWDAKGDWQRAHRCAQEDKSADGAAVHAYLHRKEGDLANARYWYARANKPAAEGPLQSEWEALAASVA